MKKDILHQISEIKATENTAKWEFDVSHPTIFHEMLSSKILPAEEKTIKRLGQEGQILVQGGTLTTSWVLTLCTFHLLDQPPVLRRLRDELCAAIPDPHAVVPLTDLERLPYLRAVVKEGLRLGFGTSGRLTRICPDEKLTYTDAASGLSYALPPGTAVSMTSYKTLTDETIFPEPFAFRPERWLVGVDKDGGDATVSRLDAYLTVFGAGGRVCLGMALAQAELLLAIAKMFRVWGGVGDTRPGDVGVARCVDTTAKDCEMASDYFIPIPYSGSKGVRAVFELSASG